MEPISDYYLADAVIDALLKSPAMRAFRSTIILEIIQVVRPLIEAPYVNELHTLKDKAPDNEELAALVTEAISKLNGSSDARS